MQGKAACIVACSGSFSGPVPAFNRLCGVVEWKNAIALFVNVGGSDYENVFAVCPRGGVTSSAPAPVPAPVPVPVITAPVTGCEAEIGVPSVVVGTAVDSGTAGGISSTTTAVPHTTRPVAPVHSRTGVEVSVASDHKVAGIKTEGGGSAAGTAGGCSSSDVAPVGPTGIDDPAAGDPGGDSVVRMSWFASPTQHEGTPVIARLLNAGVAGSRATSVLLFCRRVQERYVYCGTLEYVSHNPQRLPMRFIWELKQSSALLSSPAFRDLLNVV